MKKVVLLLSLFVILTTSCRKLSVYPEDLDPIAGQASIVGKWKVTAATSKINLGGGLVMDYDNYAEYEECDKDDLAIFLADFTLIDDQGTDKCDPNLPQTLSGKWTLSADKKRLRVDFPANDLFENLDAEVLQLDNKTMKIESKVAEFGIEAVINVTFTRVN